MEFLGYVPQQRMIELLGASDLFVLVSSVRPHSHEGLGIVCLEALAEGESGLFADSVDLEVVTAALRRFLRGEIRFSPCACRAHA